MKKFSFLLLGAFLLWTITFALADEAKDAEAATWATVEATTWDVAEAATWAVSEPVSSDSAKSKYSEEQVAAYEWALEKGITTINDIEKAKLSDWLTRAQLAKMMSQYLTNVLFRLFLV